MGIHRELYLFSNLYILHILIIRLPFKYICPQTLERKFLQSLGLTLMFFKMNYHFLTISTSKDMVFAKYNALTFIRITKSTQNRTLMVFEYSCA